MWPLSPEEFWLYDKAVICDHCIHKQCFWKSCTVLFSRSVGTILPAETSQSRNSALLWTQHYITMIDYSSRNHTRLQYELWMQHNTPVAVYPTLWCKPGTLSANRGSLSLITKPDSSECWQFLAPFHLGGYDTSIVTPFDLDSGWMCCAGGVVSFDSCQTILI